MTYQEFLTKGISLSPLGIEQAGDYPAYFCMPKDAKIFGSAGVDGIHFCFIPKFGDMVFAVSPMNAPGEYVHPIARSFPELLSLLVSCSHVAAAEQAWAWDKEMFYKFLGENLPTNEQEETMRRLETELSVPFMEEPFDYIRTLQSSFDYSGIEFTDEYYDVLGEDAPSAQNELWQVFFAGGYWHSPEEGEHPGTERPLNAAFTWGDEGWHIPSLYLCEKGFVLDFCVEIQPEKMSAFIARFAQGLADESLLTEDERQEIEEDNPLNVDVRSHFTINGRPTRQTNGSGLSYIPDSILPEGERNDAIACKVLDHYSLDSSKAWAFLRVSCPWPRGKKPAEITALALRLQRRPVTVSGVRFTDPQPGDAITFTHPVTGAEHTLTVCTYERNELTPQPGHNGFSLPTHHAVMTYSFSPDIPAGEVTVRDCAESDQLRVDTKQGEFTQTAATIGIIGGADGPTAMFVSPPDGGEHRTALSSFHFEPAQSIQWKLQFRHKRLPDLEVTLT